MRCYPCAMRSIFILAAALSFAGCATVQPDHPAAHPEARPFAAASPGSAAVDAALARASASNKHVILIFGSDACHDSRGLAGWFATPRFAAMLEARYEIVWIDVGFAKNGQPEIARRFGLGPIVGTPTVLIVKADGTPINLADAPTWRNAWSRSEDEIFAYFQAWASRG